MGAMAPQGFQPKLALAAEEYDQINIGLDVLLAAVDPLGYPRLSRMELNVQMCFFDHLFRRDKDGKIVGHLATGYKWLDDNTMRVTLRKGVKFHNGDEFTAEDVRFSIHDMMNPDRGPGLVGVTKGITEVKVIDRYTADFIVERPIPSLPAKLACYTLMVSKNDRDGRDPKLYEKKPMGTGPFKFIEWKKGEYVKAVRNEDYFLGVPKIKRVTFFPIADMSTRVSALKSGEIDIAVNISPNQAEELNKHPELEVTATPSSRCVWIWIRTDQKPFDDKRVRQALNYAVNNQEFVSELLDGYGLPIGQIAPPYFFGHNPDIKPYPYDPEKAKKLLAEAGIPKNFQITMELGTPFEEGARAVAGYLESIGLRVKLLVKEFGAAYADMLERKMAPLYYMSWGNWSLLDIDGTLLDCFGCTNKQTGVGRWSYYCNPRIEEIITELRTTDDVQRLKVAREAGQILHDEAPLIYLYAQNDIHAKKKGIPEFKARMDNTFRLKWIKGKGEF
jgi:peptide/nickel transport system substrate-binding protein